MIDPKLCFTSLQSSEQGKGGELHQTATTSADQMTSFFVLGIHDGESGSRGSTVWATQTRKRLFPNPEPNHFYTGNDQREQEVGLPQNYYQWKWGDAQFIVLTTSGLIYPLRKLIVSTLTYARFSFISLV